MKRVRLAVVLAVVLAALLWAYSRHAAAPAAHVPELTPPRHAVPLAEAAPKAQPAVEAELARRVAREAWAGAGTDSTCHEVTLVVDGVSQLRWVDSMGAPCDPGDAVIAMDVVDEHGLAAEDAWIVPVDCAGLEPGPPRVTQVPTGTCTVRAMRRDGALFARSEPVTVEVTSDDAAYVLLELSSTRTGGIGVRFQPDDQGIRVMYVVEGSPADEAGLHAGDLVLDVGGEPTAGMDPDTFVERMTGAEGTDVTFTVGWADDTGLVEETVTVIRRFLDG